MYNGMQSWNDLDRTLAEMDTFRRQLEHAFDVFEPASRRKGATQYLGWSAFPEASLHDDGDALVLVADVPGLTAEQIDLQVTAAGLTLQGERRVEVPEGYQVHRQERRSFKFSRAFAFPVKIDVEKVTAEARNGVLTVRLPKAAEVQPRRITVAG